MIDKGFLIEKLETWREEMEGCLRKLKSDHSEEYEKDMDKALSGKGDKENSGY